MKLATKLSVVALLIGAAASSYAATYSGNGMIYSTNGAFTGVVGGGSLTLTDDGTTVFGTFTKGPDNSATGTGIGGGNGQFNNNLVIYIDSVAGGFADTSGFKDTQDGSRKAISGYNNTTQFSVMTFAPGFLPDYGISLRSTPTDSFGGLWGLANGAANSLPFKQNVTLSPLATSTAATYTFSFTLANIGLTPGAGESFNLFGTFVSNTGNRSGEAIAGNDVATTATLKGFVPFTQTAFVPYTTTVVVPEPSILALFGISGLVAVRAIRRKR
ncbi:MAG: PEP-CTERM sorting domain-containing protein [Verrucomicrobia bacterium]|nr:PEP-CTERM sorting domain-containing protein [Verrucomicrobiota bacterium]